MSDSSFESDDEVVEKEMAPVKLSMSEEQASAMWRSLGETVLDQCVANSSSRDK